MICLLYINCKRKDKKLTASILIGFWCGLCVLVSTDAYLLPAMRTLNYLCVLITGYAPPLSPMRIHRRLCALTPLCTSPVKNNDNLHKKRAWMYLLKEIQSCP